MPCLLNSKTKFRLLPAALFMLAALPAHAATPALTLFYQDQKFPVDAQVLSSWQRQAQLPTSSNLMFSRPQPQQLAAEFFEQSPEPTPLEKIAYNYSPAAVYNYISSLAQKLDTPAVEPELTILNQRAIKFTPPQDGLSTDVFASTQSALFALENNSTSTRLIISVAPPRTKLSDLNDLGINELVARGESAFKGSPSNRRHNIKIGVEKMSGIILAPGEEFSFNKFLGPVEAEEGFLPELVIKKEGTIPELGGGLCQVSSTTFRAAMAAGLPIKERKNHAYAVQYYSPQGTDATIYPGSVDLKFINDTPGSLLIWPYLKDKDHLNFDFYGTKDNRTVTLSKPVTYDRKDDGSMKATWEREVVKNGIAKKDVFKSVYQSPALFHKEETFVKASSTPPSIQPTPATTGNSTPKPSTN